MTKLIHSEHGFGVMCSGCDSPIRFDLVNRTNYELIGMKYRVECSNLRCGHPVNEYKLEKVEHFQVAV